MSFILVLFWLVIQALSELFGVHGTVESIRLRSISFNDPSLPRRVAVTQKAFHEQRDSCNAYIVMDTEEHATNALVLNGTTFDAHVLRVDLAKNSNQKLDNSRTVFVGNLYFGALEDEVRALFAVCGDIETVRIIRDPATNVGKGFAFVCFKLSKSVRAALTFHNAKFHERPLRVTKVVDQDVIK